MSLTERTGRLLRPLAAALVISSAVGAGAAAPDEFKIKREAVFEFTAKPTVTRDGDRAVIRFETRGYCDVTVAVEDSTGRILRHLASGVLGRNAPPPLRSGSKKQAVVWDGKDDQGRYVDNKDKVVIRVSLGLRPRYERSLFWEPRKRIGAGKGLGITTAHALPVPLVRATAEGVCVFEGHGVDHLRLFDHKGDYVRTIYPFPAGKLGKVKGLYWHRFPQDGKRLPIKAGFLQATFLTSGMSANLGGYLSSMFGSGATAMAVRAGRIALANLSVNRLGIDGSSGGLPLQGPKLSYHAVLSGMNIGRGTPVHASPTSAAFSPDGKWLYLTGFAYRWGVHLRNMRRGYLPGVVRIAYESNQPPEVFLGSMKEDQRGSDNAHFTDPTSVDVDAKGRIYISDYMNDRIQVFRADGTFLKGLPAHKPVRVRIHHRTGQIYVFSWVISNEWTLGRAARVKDIRIPPTLTVYGPLAKPDRIASYRLPLPGSGRYSRGDFWGGLQHYAELDSWTDPPTLWLVPNRTNIQLWQVREGKLVLLRDFQKETARSVKRTVPPFFWRQRLCVNPKTGDLYVAEGQTSWFKACHSPVRIDPETGEAEIVKLPFDAEDMTFDIDGLAYLRSYRLLARYDPIAAGRWREVPFDYGIERENVGSGRSTPVGYKRAEVASGIMLSGGWHCGGMYVSAKGNTAVHYLRTKGDYEMRPQLRTDEKLVTPSGGAKGAYNPKYTYQPRTYPGRLFVGEIHILDRHGRVIREDVVPGLPPDNWGIGIDKDDNVYVHTTLTRRLKGYRLDKMDGPALLREDPSGKGLRYFSYMTGTLMKFKPGRGRIISSARRHVPVPLNDRTRPKRQPDVHRTMTGSAWAEGAEWLYGGVGFCGKNAPHASGGCSCWNCRFTLDYFARSFVPEVDRHCVAVLDTNGNLILRIGQYGNVDDGVPLIRAGGPPSPRALAGASGAGPSGDEVGLFRPAYLATHTDRRLFIADPGNARIVSVRLGYHTTEKVALKDVPAGRGDR